MRVNVTAAIEELRIPFTDARVHEARRALKRARAELRLVRARIGETQFRAANRLLRDVGRDLSPWRDARVLVDACDAVAAKLEAVGPRRLLRGIRADLARRHRALRVATRPTTEMTQHARQRLAAVLERARRWPAGPLDAELLSAGAARMYRSGRRSLAAARRERSTPSLHEWRKQSKYLAEGLASLGGGRGLKIDRLAGGMSLIAQLLGEDHDLNLLRECVAAWAGTAGDPEATRAVLEAIGKRRGKLQRKAFAAGKTLFAQRPRRFEARVGKALLNRH